jgi:alkaline phosphatase D
MNRRTFLKLTTLSASSIARLDALAAGGRAPAVMSRVLRESAAPLLPSGVQTGDVTDTSGILWSRTDRAARMMVEVSARESMEGARLVQGPAATEATGYTAQVDLDGLAPGEPVFYRVWFEDLAQPGLRSAPCGGRFRTAPRLARGVRICWSGDTVGQGWGINPEFGGLRLYETMARHSPDLFVNSGDLIYADDPLVEEVRLDSGEIWRNRVPEAKRKVAETLDEFRGNYAYYLSDAHAQAFNAQVPSLAQWDDHDVLNNWNSGKDLSANPRYRVKDVLQLASLGRQAMFEHLPIRRQGDDPNRIYRSYRYGPLLEVFLLDERSYRGPNTENRQPMASRETEMLGGDQLEWLKRRLLTSDATWKVIASDQPIGLLIGDGERESRPLFEAWANGDGPPLGRELELRDLLTFLRDRDLRNVVWITADVHYAAAHRFDPSAAVFKEFLPFWEFVAGPLHAGTFGPNCPDPTFGCTPVFVGVPEGMKPNRPPSEGLQFFGTLDADAATGRLSVGLWNLNDEKIWSVDLDPEPDR